MSRVTGQPCPLLQACLPSLSSLWPPSARHRPSTHLPLKSCPCAPVLIRFPVGFLSAGLSHKCFLMLPLHSPEILEPAFPTVAHELDLHNTVYLDVNLYYKI